MFDCASRSQNWRRSVCERFHVSSIPVYFFRNKDPTADSTTLWVRNRINEILLSHFMRIARLRCRNMMPWMIGSVAAAMKPGEKSGLELSQSPSMMMYGLPSSIHPLRTGFIETTTSR